MKKHGIWYAIMVSCMSIALALQAVGESVRHEIVLSSRSAVYDNYGMVDAFDGGKEPADVVQLRKHHAELTEHDNVGRLNKAIELVKAKMMLSSFDPLAIALPTKAVIKKALTTARQRYQALVSQEALNINDRRFQWLLSESEAARLLKKNGMKSFIAWGRRRLKIAKNDHETAAAYDQWVARLQLHMDQFKALSLTLANDFAVVDALELSIAHEMSAARYRKAFLEHAYRTLQVHNRADALEKNKQEQQVLIKRFKQLVERSRQLGHLRQIIDERRLLSLHVHDEAEPWRLARSAMN